MTPNKRKLRECSEPRKILDVKFSVFKRQIGHKLKKLESFFQEENTEN